MRDVGVSAAKIVLYLALGIGLAVGYIAIIAPAIGLPVVKNMSRTAEFVFEAAQFLSMFVPAALMMWFMDGKAPAAMGFAPRRMGGDFLSGAVVGAFIFFVGLGVAFAAGWARLDLQLQNFSMAALGFSAVVMAIHAAMEEVMFRGFILQELMSKFSTTAAVLVSSLIFVALHAGGLVKDEVGIVGAANIFLASLLMSVAYLRTRHLWLPIGLHAGWNFTQGPLLGINVSGNDVNQGWHAVALEGSKWVTGGEFGFEASLPGLVGPALGIVLMLLFVRPKAEA